MPAVVEWSGVCVHCTAQIGGTADRPMHYPATLRQPCHACKQPLVITLLEQGAMVAAPHYWRPYPLKP